MKVTVDYADIAGADWTPRNCVVARALQRQFPGETVAVGFYIAKVGRRYYTLPKEVERYIHRFIAGEAVGPIVFEMTSVTEAYVSAATLG